MARPRPGLAGPYLALDQTVHYAYLKTVLQALTRSCGAAHLGAQVAAARRATAALTATFPDATFAFTTATRWR